jgi:hypothetical protein
MQIKNNTLILKYPLLLNITWEYLTYYFIFLITNLNAEDKLQLSIFLGVKV